MFLKKMESEESILKRVYEKGRLKRLVQFFIGIMIVAFSFNLFILPTEIVYGVSGVGVILKKLFGFDPAVVIFISSILLLLLSLVLLGPKSTRNTILGSLLYPVFVKLFEWVPDYIHLGNTDPLLMTLFGSALSGFGLGLIFKAGYTTGGTDILNQIVSKYAKISLGNSMFFTDGLIILGGVFVFGWQKFMYSIISLYMISVMTDKVVLGISESKIFYIVTEHETEVKNFILKHLSHGVTVLEGRGGFTGDRQKVIMCMVPTKEYFVVKEAILQIDKKAFFVVSDAYEVSGGA